MLTKLLRDLEQTNIPFYISSSSHLCRPFNRKILDVALLCLRFCSIRDDKSDPNLSVKTGVSVYSKALIAGIRLYQFFISPLTGRSCRFYPTCSHYSIQSLQQYGAFMGVLRSLRRIAKCHPFHPGGYDPIK